MTIEWKVGGKYLTRGGEVVTVENVRDFDEWSYPIQLENGGILTKHGYWLGEEDPHDKDIISEYIEPEQPDDEELAIEVDGKTYQSSDGINWTMRTETTVLTDRTNKLYDLEQHIIACSLVTEDINTVLKMTDVREVSEDELFNVLNGIRTLYDMKFELLNKAYESLLQAGEQQ